MARAELEQVMKDLCLAVKADFIPWSKSRHAGDKDRSLNWKVGLWRRTTITNVSGYSFTDRLILTTFYTAGIAHCPSYSQFDHRTIYAVEAIEAETEHGKAVTDKPGFMRRFGQPILPDPCDVLYSLSCDADAIDYSTFDAWATNYGLDVDSRKAEKTWRDCLEIGLALRNGLGEDGLRKLREAAQDY